MAEPTNKELIERARKFQPACSYLEPPAHVRLLNLLASRLEAAERDAARWRAIEYLWFLGSVELDAEPEGMFEIRIDPAESSSEIYKGMSQADAVDEAIAKLDSRNAAISSEPKP